MGWDHGGRYYTRSRREGGRVVREYVGCGHDAALIARFDAVERDRRDGERIAALDAPLLELDTVADLVARSARTAAGYRQHHRGEWRTRGSAAAAT